MSPFRRSCLEVLGPFRTALLYGVIWWVNKLGAHNLSWFLLSAKGKGLQITMGSLRKHMAVDNLPLSTLVPVCFSIWIVLTRVCYCDGYQIVLCELHISLVLFISTLLHTSAINE